MNTPGEPTGRRRLVFASDSPPIRGGGSACALQRVRTLLRSGNALLNKAAATFEPATGRGASG